MHRIDNPNVTGSLPTPGPVGTPGFFAQGVTEVDGDWLNAVQQEMENVITDDGTALDKTKQNQLVAAVKSLSQKNVLHVVDQQNPGVNGQSFTTSVWNKCRLGTVIKNNITGASVASDVVTLPAGTFRIWYRATTHYSATSTTQRAGTRLYNTSDSALIIEGDPIVCWGNNGSSGNQKSSGCVEFTLAASKNIELQVQPDSTSWLGGLAGTGSSKENYHELFIEEVLKP